MDRIEILNRGVKEVKIKNSNVGFLCHYLNIPMISLIILPVEDISFSSLV